VCNIITKTAKDLQKLVQYEDRDEFFVSARKFVLLLHGKKAKCQASLDDLRYHLATTTDKPANQLPPTKTHLNNMSYEHSTKFQFEIKAIYQNLKWQVLLAMDGTYQNHDSFVQCITQRSRPPLKSEILRICTALTKRKLVRNVPV